MIENGTVYCFGMNYQFQLGIEDQKDRVLPDELTTLNQSTNTVLDSIECGASHTVFYHKYCKNKIPFNKQTFQLLPFKNILFL